VFAKQPGIFSVLPLLGIDDILQLGQLSLQLEELLLLFLNGVPRLLLDPSLDSSYLLPLPFGLLGTDLQLSRQFRQVVCVPLAPSVLVSHAALQQDKVPPEPLDRFDNGSHRPDERFIDRALVAPEAAKKAGPATHSIILHRGALERAARPFQVGLVLTRLRSRWRRFSCGSNLRQR
jgi:hypothetical protein